jgi:hypothetical protein
MPKAYLGDYIQWLEGYLRKGGKPTHYYHYPWARSGFEITSGSLLQGVNAVLRLIRSLCLQLEAIDLAH